MAVHNPPDFTLDSSDIRIPERGVVCLDADGVVKHTNSRMEEIFGANARELVGRDYRETCAGHLQSRVRNGQAFVQRIEAVCGGSTDTIEDVVVLTDGAEEITLHRYSSPMLDADGALVGRVEVFSDITSRRQFEQVILDRTNELAMLNQELQRAQERLVHAAKLAALGELSAGVAHHLNNVLGVILGNVQLAQRQELDPGLRGKLQNCELAAMDGAKTVERIRALAKPEQCPLLGSVNLNSVVREIVRLTKPKWKDEPRLSGVEVRLVMDLGELPAIQGNATDLREVVANVVLNAVQAMPGGGAITIRTSVDGEFAVLSVADTGLGMSAETKSRIFDPFYTTRGAEGTGLGMSIADAVVSKHGGEIRIDSELGRGSEIIIRLPLNDVAAMETDNVVKSRFLDQSRGPVGPRRDYARNDMCDDAADETGGSARNDSDDGAGNGTSTANVLVVDDEAMFGQVIGQMLTEGGHRATVLTTPSEVLEKLAEGCYDVLLTDFAMPGMNGCELARAAKNADPGLGVVLISGFGAVEDKREIAESGIDLVLGKPIQQDELLEGISRALGMRVARE